MQHKNKHPTEPVCLKFIVTLHQQNGNSCLYQFNNQEIATLLSGNSVTKACFSFLKSCFPVMGVILTRAGLFFLFEKLLPRYGGYSVYAKQWQNLKMVASPLWGLFLGNFFYKKILKELLPRYGGYS